jgi:hypothetical protein
MSYVRIRSRECATPRDVLVRSIESGAGQILLEADALPPLFYDLSSGAAGDLVQGLANNGIRMAVVVRDLTRHSDAFQAFVKEANRGRAFRFFESDAEAEEWLRETEER